MSAATVRAGADAALARLESGRSDARPHVCADRAVPVTLDGSEIREWAGPVSAPARNQSLAEATIPVGAGATTEHYHRTSEELYLVSTGEGRLLIDGEERTIGEGDCALISPGARHKVFNIGDVPLRIVCACAPCLPLRGHLPDRVSALDAWKQRVASAASRS